MTTEVIIVTLIALLAARFINWAIYSWAYYSKQIGPWSAAVTGGQRSWIDHLPIIGWWFLRREAGLSEQHAKLYWLRPMLIELFFPLFILWYFMAYTSGHMFPAGPMQAEPFLKTVRAELLFQFGAHFCLFSLMSIATFIDFDEHSIPDTVTIPGAIIGLVGATFAPAWLPFHPVVPSTVLELDAALPLNWPPMFVEVTGLWIALAILLVWGFALLDRVWITRRGYRKAIEYYMVYLVRRPKVWGTVLAMTIGLMLMTGWAWTNLNPEGRWPFLLSSLLGLAFAGGVTWGVRVSASVGLGVEALGFGDVTLMAMIGTYIGWQPSLVVFFLAPLIAILFVLLRAVITGRTVTPYGPYLCAATAVVLVFWNDFWFGWAARYFVLGPQIVGIIAACVVLMGVMLWIWRLIKQVLGIEVSQN